MTVKNLAVLCSGGDSPGMNNAVRAVVRTAIKNDINIFGIKKGYSGLLQGDFIQMDVASVGNILQRGGTIIQTSRCPEFLKKDIRKEAANILKRKNIDGLIIIGGNGSFNGAMDLHLEHKIPIIGIPGTIDNDIMGTDYTIGFDTAVHTAISAVDKIRDTAHSHQRTFVVEVMGRKSPAIALHVGICTGAESIIFPNKKVDYDLIASSVQRGIKRGKESSIIIAAEGETPGVSAEIGKILATKYGIKTRVCILGHIQRGGSPGPLDRFLASQMGLLAVNALIKGEQSMVTAYREGRVTLAPLSECLGKKTETSKELLEIVETLSI